ncbi:DoxX family protein [Geodermatophilus sp. CPCC 205761]|uniref:DoxX family protein n=1 Tax=Geodermatophilus sp. CPCC 205761 TaxID=2936597 RepID=UPI003EEE9B2C
MVLAFLAGTYVLARLVPSRRGRRSSPDAARAAMATAMAAAGASHLADPQPFVQHLPEFVPARERVILGTGLLEMLLGAGLAAPTRRRREIALALAAYLLAVFPANVYVAVAGVRIEGLPGASHPWLRLPLQAVYVAWTFWAVPGAWELMLDRARRLRNVLSDRQHAGRVAMAR